MKEEKEKGRRNDKTNYRFVFNGKTELLDRDCSLPMDEKKIRVCVYTRAIRSTNVGHLLRE